MKQVSDSANAKTAPIIPTFRLCQHWHNRIREPLQALGEPSLRSFGAVCGRIASTGGNHEGSDGGGRCCWDAYGLGRLRKKLAGQTVVCDCKELQQMQLEREGKKNPGWGWGMNAAAEGSWNP